MAEQRLRPTKRAESTGLRGDKKLARALRILATEVSEGTASIPTPFNSDVAIVVSFLTSQSERKKAADLIAVLDDQASTEWTTAAGTRYRAIDGRLIGIHLSVVQLLAEQEGAETHA